MQMDNCSSTNTFKARLNVPVFKSLFSYFKPAPTHNDSNQRKPRFSHISLLSRIWWQTKERILPLRQISSSPQKFARQAPPPFLLHVFANLQYRQLITNYLLCFTFLLLFLSLLRVIIQNVIQIFWNHIVHRTNIDYVIRHRIGFFFFPPTIFFWWENMRLSIRSKIPSRENLICPENLLKKNCFAGNPLIFDIGLVEPDCYTSVKIWSLTSMTSSWSAFPVFFFNPHIKHT